MAKSGKSGASVGSHTAKEILGAPTLYREWGYRFTRTEEYPSAIKAFQVSQAQSENDDLRTLLGLSRALSRNTKYHEAAEVIDRCMEIGEVTTLRNPSSVNDMVAFSQTQKTCGLNGGGFRRSSRSRNLGTVLYTPTRECNSTNFPSSGASSRGTRPSRIASDATCRLKP